LAVPPEVIRRKDAGLTTLPDRSASVHARSPITVAQPAPAEEAMSMLTCLAGTRDKGRPSRIARVQLPVCGSYPRA
jgi:hypothetical protein